MKLNESWNIEANFNLLGIDRFIVFFFFYPWKVLMKSFRGKIRGKNRYMKNIILRNFGKKKKVFSRVTSHI